MHKIVVIGAGPSGMIAAIRAAQLRSSVTLVEKNPSPGKKLLLCGKGRCNLTNACALDDFLSRFSRSGPFLRDAFKAFFNDDLMSFFEKRGVRLKVERQDRVFPATDSSKSILDALIGELERQGVRPLLGTSVEAVKAGNGRVLGVYAGGSFMAADRVILATGGLSYPGTGSTGEGFAMAKNLGHHIVPLRPGLVPLDITGKVTAGLEGLTLKNIRLTFSGAKRTLVSEIGEMVFTSTGVSGPLVLTLSGQVVDMLAAGGQVFLDVDLKPALTKDEVDRRLQRECAMHGARFIRTMMEELLPRNLVLPVLEACGIPGLRKASSLTREERLKLVEALKGFRLIVKCARTFREAMITRGGVSLKEVDPRTMESRLVKGLYFCGEILDVDADTGGFNLQAAFSTGYLAGMSAAEK